MKLTNTDIGLSIDIGDKLINELIETGRQHYPNEFVGLLIGYYSNDIKTVHIQKTLLPKKYKSSKYSFERGSKGLRTKLEKLYRKTPSLVYVGEWHTHPDNPAVPSGVDASALREIVDNENVAIANPILLIISICKKFEQLCFYVYFKNKIYKYDLVKKN